MKKSNKEQLKEKIECEVFHMYEEFHKEIISGIVKKEERPDFVVSIGDKCIGIEITELTTEHDKVLQRILDDNRANKYSDEIRESAIKTHGAKASKYKYHNNNGHLGIGSGVVGMDCRKKQYAWQIKGKYKKYKEEISKFDEFIILCHLTDPLIDHDYEVKEILDMVDLEYRCDNLKVSIIYTDEQYRRSLQEKEF